MVRPIILVLGAIPAVIAALFAIPLLTNPEIPFSAAVPEDNIEIEYTVHDPAQGLLWRHREGGCG